MHHKGNPSTSTSYSPTTTTSTTNCFVQQQHENNNFFCLTTKFFVVVGSNTNNSQHKLNVDNMCLTTTQCWKHKRKCVRSPQVVCFNSFVMFSNNKTFCVVKQHKQTFCVSTTQVCCALINTYFVFQPNNLSFPNSILV